MPISLGKLPSPPKEYCVEFSKLNGGLNLRELPYRLKNTESPDLLNLWWQDGVLCARDGQAWLDGGETRGTGYSAFAGTFHGNGFFHIGTGLWRAELEVDGLGEAALTRVLEGVGEGAGSWFLYGDKLYYKNPGGYYAVSFDGDEGTFSAGAVEGYSPVILINADPDTAAGDAYQPENRICAQKTVWYSSKEGVRVYHLPVTGVDSVDRVVVDGVELEAVTGYTVNRSAGTVTFAAAPPVHDPVSANTVEITYSKANQEAMDSIMKCRYAAVFGGDRNVCVVLAGCPAQPNAYFWSGAHAAMDPAYFPMEQFNLAGSGDEAVTGFGRQQSMLVVFKEHSVGRASFETAEMGSGRVLLSMPYTPVNSAVGCDIPESIQLIENNLVFANRRQGVHMVLDSSAAYENNIVCLSGKVNGSPGTKGLLLDAAGASRAASFDDDSRYWLALGDKVYCWDYAASGRSDPSWFLFDGVAGAAFLKTEGGVCCHLDGLGRLSRFRRDWTDYGEGFLKRYRFAGQHMGEYDRLKDVLRCVFTVRGDTDTDIDVEYETDYERRMDLTPIRAYSNRLSPRNLSFRFLAVRRFATVAVRKPGCRHVRHFSMTLTGAEPGQDMTVISAAVYFRYQARDR